MRANDNLIKIACVTALVYFSYGTAQFKLDIYMRVTWGFMDKFLMPLTSFMWANHYNIHLHTCHSRVAWQIYQVTHELHTTSKQICQTICVLHANIEQICWATHELHASEWSLGTYHVICKMYAWSWHLWIRFWLTHYIVYSHCSLFYQLQPVIIQYRPDCWLDPSTSAY